MVCRPRAGIAALKRAITLSGRKVPPFEVQHKNDGHVVATSRGSSKTSLWSIPEAEVKAAMPIICQLFQQILNVWMECCHSPALRRTRLCDTSGPTATRLARRLSPAPLGGKIG